METGLVYPLLAMVDPRTCFVAVLLLVAGVVVFWSAMDAMRWNRQTANLPLSSIGQLPFGDAAVQGRAHAPATITSPLGQATCIYAKTIVRVYRNRSWYIVDTVELPGPFRTVWFEVSDDSGSVTVLPAGAKGAYSVTSVHTRTGLNDGDFSAGTAAFLAPYGLDSDLDQLWLSECYLEQDATVYVRGSVTDAVDLPKDARPASLPADTHTIIWCDGDTPSSVAVGGRSEFENQLRRSTIGGAAIGAVCIFAALAMGAWQVLLALPHTEAGQAAANGNIAGVSRALDAIPERRRDASGLTPLMADAQRNDGAAVRRDLAAGASIDATGPEGETALRYAVRARALDSVVALLAAGADPDAADVAGDTALFDAARASDVSIIQALLHAGAHPQLRNLRRERARDVAVTAAAKRLL